MPMLAKWPISRLKNRTTALQIAEKHIWPESMVGLLFKMLKMTIADFVTV